MKIKEKDKHKRHVRVLIQLLDKKQHSRKGKNIYVQTTDFNKVYKIVKAAIKNNTK